MRSLVAWNPVRSLAGLDPDLDRLFESVFSDAPLTSWTPAVDIVGHEDRYVLRIDLPGMRREDISITVENQNLVVRGERKQEKHEETAEYVRSERFGGRFARSFRLGDRVSTDGVSAAYRDGVLEVTVPKTAEAKPRQIEVK
jgi:HSP20 family protein